MSVGQARMFFRKNIILTPFRFLGLYLFEVCYLYKAIKHNNTYHYGNILFRGYLSKQYYFDTQLVLLWNTFDFC